MTGCRVQYSPPADQSHRAMGGPLRTRFDSAMQRLAADPYGQDSIPIRGDRDRREATVAGVAVRYYVSATVLTVSVVRVVFV